MQGGRGGSLGLARLLHEHGEAIEADFSRFYQGEDPQAITLRRLGVLIRGLLKIQESLLYKALADDTWSRTDHLLALVHDQLAIANWQRTKAGNKGRNRPKPISPLAQRGKRSGKTDRSPEQVMAFLARLNPAQYSADSTVGQDADGRGDRPEEGGRAANGGDANENGHEDP